jgi:hypothetical protein
MYPSTTTIKNVQLETKEINCKINELVNGRCHEMGIIAPILYTRKLTSIHCSKIYGLHVLNRELGLKL